MLKINKLLVGNPQQVSESIESPEHYEDMYAYLSELDNQAWKKETRIAEVLDYLYKAHLLNALSSAGEFDQKMASALVDHLGKMTHPSRKEGLSGSETDFYSRWTVYRSLLTDFMHSYVEVDLDYPLGRQHVSEILKRVPKKGTIAQKELVDAQCFGNSANVSRIIKLMARYKLVSIRKQGRMNLIGLGHQGRKLMISPERVLHPETNFDRHQEQTTSLKIDLQSFVPNLAYIKEGPSLDREAA